MSRRYATTGYRMRRRLYWASAAVALLGAIAALFVLLPNRNPPPQVFSSVSAVDAKTPIKVPLSEEARLVATRFVLTAVARKDLAEAWALSGQNIPETTTLDRLT